MRRISRPPTPATPSPRFLLRTVGRPHTARRATVRNGPMAPSHRLGQIPKLQIKSRSATGWLGSLGHIRLFGQRDPIKKAPERGFLRADDGTRTHDLLLASEPWSSPICAGTPMNKGIQAPAPPSDAGRSAARFGWFLGDLGSGTRSLPNARSVTVGVRAVPAGGPVLPVALAPPRVHPHLVPGRLVRARRGEQRRRLRWSRLQVWRFQSCADECSGDLVSRAGMEPATPPRPSTKLISCRS